MVVLIERKDGSREILIDSYISIYKDKGGFYWIDTKEYRIETEKKPIITNEVKEINEWL